jgi:hypothetical protein
MGLRWTAAGMLEAEKQFRKVIGYTDLPRLAVAIEQRLHLPQPNPPPTRRPPSQSLCNDHTGTAVTEVPRRSGQPPDARSERFIGIAAFVLGRCGERARPTGRVDADS